VARGYFGWYPRQWSDECVSKTEERTVKHTAFISLFQETLKSLNSLEENPSSRLCVGSGAGEHATVELTLMDINDVCQFCRCKSDWTDARARAHRLCPLRGQASSERISLPRADDADEEFTENKPEGLLWKVWWRRGGRKRVEKPR
jgi:hypothetical protein